jgi:CBS domain-containing protein
MTGNVVCVRREVSIESLTALFLERDISGAPVVDDSGAPVGVVSKTDLVRERYMNGESVDAEPLQVTQRRGLTYPLGGKFHAEPVARATVADIMTPLAFTLHESTPLSQAAALMAYEGVHRVPVVSDDGRVVGVLSSLDVTRWLAEHHGYIVRDPTPERCA